MHTFVVKAVDAINAGAFMIASQEEEVFRILNLVGQQQTVLQLYSNRSLKF